MLPSQAASSSSGSASRNSSGTEWATNPNSRDARRETGQIRPMVAGAILKIWSEILASGSIWWSA
jgi:hypothetical protein